MRKTIFIKWGIIAIIIVEAILVFVYFGQKSIDKEAGIERTYCCLICPVCLTIGNE